MNNSRIPPVIASMKTNLIGMAVVAVTLTSFAVLADDGRHHCAGAVNRGYQPRPTQQWIPDRYEEVTVQTCREHRQHGWKRWAGPRCRTTTETRLIPGHYQAVQEWVRLPRGGHRQDTRDESTSGSESTDLNASSSPSKEAFCLGER